MLVFQVACELLLVDLLHLVGLTELFPLELVSVDLIRTSEGFFVDVEACLLCRFQRLKTHIAKAQEFILCGTFDLNGALHQLETLDLTELLKESLELSCEVCDRSPLVVRWEALEVQVVACEVLHELKGVLEQRCLAILLLQALDDIQTLLWHISSSVIFSHTLGEASQSCGSIFTILEGHKAESSTRINLHGDQGAKGLENLAQVVFRKFLRGEVLDKQVVELLTGIVVGGHTFGPRDKNLDTQGEVTFVTERDLLAVHLHTHQNVRRVSQNAIVNLQLDRLAQPLDQW